MQSMPLAAKTASACIEQVPLLTVDKSAVMALFAPAYAKANGCPATLGVQGVACNSCLLHYSQLQVSSHVYRNEYNVNRHRSGAGPPANRLRLRRSRRVGQAGVLHGCASEATAVGVVVRAAQLGRVSWVTRALDQGGRQAAANCSVCVDHGAAGVARCPRPFTPATPCNAGSL